MRLFIFFPLMVAFLGGCGPTAEHYNQKGAESFNQKDLAAAKAEFQKAIFFNGQNPAYHNNLGYVLYQLKDYDGAEAEFEKALVDHPGESLLRQIQIDQALLYCDSNAAGKPSHKDWNGKGITVLKELLEKDPNNAELHMRLGFAYFQGANPGGGFSELNKAVQLATPEMTAHYTQQPAQGALMILKEIQGFYAKIRYFKKVQEIQKDITKIEKEIKISPTKTS